MARPSEPAPRALTRVVGVPGAILLGLGSILGTGLFVSVGIAAGVAGPAILLAVALAAPVATCNGLSSAQLAARHPVSGGTYEYGYRYLGPRFGFVAGWMFLCAKSASAATAALGFAGYLLESLGASGPAGRIAVALALVALLTLVVAGGMRRSNRFNALVVSFTLLAFAALIAAGLPSLLERPELWGEFAAIDRGGIGGLLEATALIFVAYTGYARIATLGEEIRTPSRNIPRAIVATLLLTMGLYLAVVAVAVAVLGADGLAAATRTTGAPLVAVASRLPLATLDRLVALAAMAAMVSVLLNLLLGLSRVVLAMGRRGDLPRALARVSEGGSPRAAVLLTGLLVGCLVASGSVRTTWSFSAFAVLVYYAITNLAALRLPAQERRYPRWVAALGLLSCLGLAFQVDPAVWRIGLLLIVAGLAWHAVASRARAA